MAKTVCTLMVALKSLAYCAFHDPEIVDQEAWSKQGEVRLLGSFVQGLAEKQAEAANAKLLKVWFDNNAGGYFADVEVEM